MANEKLKNFAVELFNIGAVKFGQYQTKVGIMTPVYCDLRVIVSYPKLMNTLAELLIEQIPSFGKIDIICGVPYTALPIATVVSVVKDLPMVMRRKEAKSYGTKKLIEGKFKEGDKCLIVEDVVTSGSSILETVKDLTDAGIDCSEAVVLLNRQQGGEQFLKSRGIKMHALLTLTQLMALLEEAKCVGKEWVEKVEAYLKVTQVDTRVFSSKPSRLKLPFSTRAGLTKNPIARELFTIMEEKKSNLCVAADLTTTTDIIKLAEEVGPYICMLKTHIDIVKDCSQKFFDRLKIIAKQKKFVLFEDRKFAEIGKVVELQYTKDISENFPVVTAHSVTGKGVLDAIKQSKGLEERGVFLLAETSAAGSLIDETYTNATLKLAQEYEELITGIVCQSAKFLDQAGFIQLTPGVQLDCARDDLGQQYNSPDKVVMERGADIAVVGRGVTQAKDRAAEAAKYQQILWKAYLRRL